VDTVELSLVPAMASFEESKQRKADIVVASAEKVPDPWKGYVVKAAPVLGAVGAGVELAMPYVSKAYDKGLELWELLQPYHPEDMACVFFGLFMCFFGGEFPALITAIEAYRQVPASGPQTRAKCCPYSRSGCVLAVKLLLGGHQHQLFE
jgi:hypothetical protein